MDLYSGCQPKTNTTKTILFREIIQCIIQKFSTQLKFVRYPSKENNVTYSFKKLLKTYPTEFWYWISKIITLKQPFVCLWREYSATHMCFRIKLSILKYPEPSKHVVNIPFHISLSLLLNKMIKFDSFASLTVCVLL